MAELRTGTYLTGKVSAIRWEQADEPGLIVFESRDVVQAGLSPNQLVLHESEVLAIIEAYQQLPRRGQHLTAGAGSLPPRRLSDEERERLQTKLGKEFGWNPGVCQSMADRLADPMYVGNFWPNLARDYPPVTLGQASEILKWIGVE